MCFFGSKWHGVNTGSGTSLLPLWQLLFENRFEIKNQMESHGQSSPKLIGILTVLRCIFGPYLKILTRIGGELLCGQVQNGIKMSFSLIWPRRSMSINLQISCHLNQGVLHFWSKLGDYSLNGEKYLWEQACDSHTHTLTYIHWCRTTITKLALGKNDCMCYLFCFHKNSSST